MSIINDLLSDLNAMLSVRDEMDLSLKEIYIVTRTWSGDEPGDGMFKDSKEQILPTPRIVDLRHQIRSREAGINEEADVMLKMISKESYPTKDLLDLSVKAKNIEKFYMVGEDLYRITSIQEKHLVWAVMLKKINR